MSTRESKENENIILWFNQGRIASFDKIEKEEKLMTATPHTHGQTIENFIDKIPPFEDFGKIAAIFKQLEDPNRLRIFWILCHSEECVTNISFMMNMSAPAVSHHLRLLKAADLIRSERNGKEVYYKATDTPLVHQLHDVMEDVLRIACPFGNDHIL